MANIREWIDREDKSARQMPNLLPILIRQARSETPITYGDVAQELGVHWRAVHHIAGYIGFTLSTIGQLPGWRKRRPPPLHALIVNSDTGVPGSGIDGFMSAAYKAAIDNRQRRAVLKSIYADANAYPHWHEVCKLLDVPLLPRSLVDAVGLARRSKGMGGEGPDHKALKMHVCKNPHLVGLRRGSKHGQPEYGTASGDKIDVVFERPSLRLGVEVKPFHASEGDLIRGAFQCLKYRTILEAEARLADEHVTIRVLLVLGGLGTKKLRMVANALGIDYLEDVPCA